jgi:hypothetical protein
VFSERAGPPKALFVLVGYQMLFYFYNAEKHTKFLFYKQINAFVRKRAEHAIHRVKRQLFPQKPKIMDSVHYLLHSLRLAIVTFATTTLA